LLGFEQKIYVVIQIAVEQIADETSQDLDTRRTFLQDFVYHFPLGNVVQTKQGSIVA
jgi:hypothetical protein